MRLVPILTLVACVPMEPSGTPFEAVPVTAPAPTTAPAPVAAAPVPARSAGGFDFDAEDRTDEDATGGAEDPVDLQAKLLGLEPLARPTTRPAPTPGLPVPVWDPSIPIPEATFGVRVLATLLDMQPPRAVLGLPDGAERVVQPGAMLPDQGLVVLAIGRDAVQLAKVTPQGFYAAVRTETVQALYPGAAGRP
jgi:hypothetical protein